MSNASRTMAIVVLVGLSAVGCSSGPMYDAHPEPIPPALQRFPEGSAARDASTDKPNAVTAESEQPVGHSFPGSDPAATPEDPKVAELQSAQIKAVEAYLKQRGVKSIAPIDTPAESATPRAAQIMMTDAETTTTEASDNPLRGAAAPTGLRSERRPVPEPALHATPPAATPEPTVPKEPAISPPATPPPMPLAIERKATVGDQFDLAVALGTEEAFRAVAAYYPPIDDDWKNRTYADRANARIEQLRKENADPAGTSDKPGPGKWKTQLGRAIESLEIDLAHESLKADETARAETALRLLYLVDNQRQKAARPISDLQPAEQAFWQHQLFGLGVYLDDSGTPVDDNRNTLALRELRRATAELAAATGKIDVRNVAFCTEVQSYGCFTEFEKPEFTADQEVVLYCEVDNFSTKELPDGSHLTSLQGSYQIYAADGRRVADHTFPLQRETCRNARRDYFIPYRMWIPKSNIFPGNYTLQLTLEDSIGEKFGQASVDFVIKEPRTRSTARRTF